MIPTQSYLREFLAAAISLVIATVARGESKLWVEYPGGIGPGQGKHIVFLSGDEEYRSEEGLPMLAKILSQRHGFRCTVLFAADRKTGEIDPNNHALLPGSEALDTVKMSGPARNSRVWWRAGFLGQWAMRKRT